MVVIRFGDVSRQSLQMYMMKRLTNFYLNSFFQMTDVVTVNQLMIVRTMMNARRMENFFGSVEVDADVDRY